MTPGDQKRIVLTGVSRGLGRAMAEEFIEEGHVVAGCARSAEAVAELNRRYGTPHAFEVVDVSRDEQVAAWAGRVLAACPFRGVSVYPSDGRVDVLINNAALINRNAPLWQVPHDEFSHLVDVNIKGTANVIRHLVPAMVQRGQGVIVNFSSGWGRSTAPQVAPYCATKWAVEGLTRALADELPSGMAAVPLNPGIINTQMLQSCFGDAAGAHSHPTDWARRAVPFILQLGPKDNGQPLSVPF